MRLQEFADADTEHDCRIRLGLADCLVSEAMNQLSKPSFQNMKRNFVPFLELPDY